MFKYNKYNKKCKGEIQVLYGIYRKWAKNVIMWDAKIQRTGNGFCAELVPVGVFQVIIKKSHAILLPFAYITSF